MENAFRTLGESAALCYFFTKKPVSQSVWRGEKVNDEAHDLAPVQLAGGLGMVAISSFGFIGSWNNFLFALMFLNDQDQFTIPVGLSYMLGEYSVDFGALAAGGVVAVVPVVLVFAYVQKFLVQGLSAGAVKG
jgi:hypothetical protein